MPNNATLVGSPSFVSAASGFGQCISLNGASQYATIPVAALSFSSGASFTVVARVKTTNGAVLAPAVTKMQPAALITDIFLGLNNGVPIGQANGFNGNSNFSGGSGLADGAWHTLALVVGSGTATLYADGTAVASGAGSYVPVGGTVIGAIGTWNAGQFLWPGQLDDVAVYSAALSGAGAINPSAPIANTAASLLSLYHLDSGNASGATVLDCAGAALTVSPATVPPGASTALSFTGVNTAWTTVSPAFSVSGGSGASMGSTTATGAGAATATLAAGTAAGTLVVADASSGATQTVDVAAPAALPYTVRGPAQGPAYLESAAFTIQMAPGLAAAMTPGDAGGGGLFRPASVTPAAGGSATFTYQPAAPGVYTISVANAGSLAAPPPLTFEAGALGPFRQAMEGGLPA